MHPDFCCASDHNLPKFEKRETALSRSCPDAQQVMQSISLFNEREKRGKEGERT
jgi:hypothetical protein